MKKRFYHHLITIDSIHVALDDLSLTAEEHQELIDIACSSIHHLVIDTILSDLSEEDKKIFLQHMNNEKYNELWRHVKNNIDNVEDKIQKVVEGFLADLHDDIQRTKLVDTLS